MLRRGQDRFKQFVPGGFGTGRTAGIVAVVLLIIWGVSGFYQVQPDEVGIPLVFGRPQEPVQPGFRWNWPTPIGDVIKPKVTTVFNVEIGVHASGALDTKGESLMLTGDQNIIDVQFTVQWKVGPDPDDPLKFVFSVRDPDSTIRSSAEAAMREVIGQTQFGYAVTGAGRREIEVKTQELLQHILNSYNAGVVITALALQRADSPPEVIESFRDVQAAQNDAERMRNEAQGYFNQVTNQAQAQAIVMVKAAEAYKAQKIAVATGDAQRFVSVYDAYAKAKDVTQRRMYLETMEQIMSGMNKVLIDKSVGGGAVPYLPLDRLVEPRPEAPPLLPPAAEAGASQ
jgi:membrane protease subunit HflK